MGYLISNFLEKKFSYWKIIGKKWEKTKNNRANYILCKCICGKEKYIMAHTLIYKKSKSCGCKVKRKRKYKCNEKYFEKIDTEDKAYFLGLLYADGYINDRFLTLKLQEKDKYILNEFKKYLKSNYRIFFIDKSNDNKTNNKTNKYQNVSNQYYLSLSSKIMCNDLKKLGCHQNKTYTLKFPHSSQVPSSLLHHFIRGFFDGDGCVSGSAYGRFTFIGTLNIISGIRKILMKKLKFNKVKLSFLKNKKICTLAYAGNKQLYKFYNYIYKDAKVFLPRKEKKMRKLVNKYLRLGATVAPC